MKLFLDTSNNLKTIVRLDENEFVRECDSPRNQDVFGTIRAALSKHGFVVTDITEIEVVTGPGSFTGLRVGVSIANALSFALSIPINQQPPGTLILPQYGSEPNITLPSK